MRNALGKQEFLRISTNQRWISIIIVQSCACRCGVAAGTVHDHCQKAALIAERTLLYSFSSPKCFIRTCIAYIHKPSALRPAFPLSPPTYTPIICVDYHQPRLIPINSFQHILRAHFRSFRTLFGISDAHFIQKLVKVAAKSRAIETLAAFPLASLTAAFGTGKATG